MDKFVTKRNDLLAEQVIKNLKSRQMEGHYVQTKEEALALALKLIPEGSSISWGVSMSIKAIGLPEALHKGNYKAVSYTHLDVYKRQHTKSFRSRNLRTSRIVSLSVCR